MTEPTIPIAIVAAVSLLAAATDLKNFRVPNGLTLPLLAAGLLYHGATAGLPGVGASLLGAAFGFAALILPYSAGGMGAGDVKLMAGVGAWLGAATAGQVLLAAALAGGVYALGAAAVSGRLIRTLAVVAGAAVGTGRPGTAPESVREVAAKPGRRARLVPFAAMIAVGLAVTIARS